MLLLLSVVYDILTRFSTSDGQSTPRTVYRASFVYQDPTSKEYKPTLYTIWAGGCVWSFVLVLKFLGHLLCTFHLGFKDSAGYMPKCSKLCICTTLHLMRVGQSLQTPPTNSSQGKCWPTPLHISERTWRWYYPFTPI